MAQIPVDEVHILSTYLESMLYGIFVVMYLACVWVLVKRRDPVRGVNKLMLFTASAMMVVATLFEEISIQRDIEAFFEHKNASPTAYYVTSSNFGNLYQSALWVTQVLIGDSLLVYRMYVVYNRRLVIVVLPIVLLMASVATGVNVIYQFSLVDASSNPKYFTQNVQPWTTSLMAVSVCQNGISTGAIALRLWWVGRHFGNWFRGRHWASITVLLESAFPYTLALIIMTILAVHAENDYDFAYYAIVPISGISFTGLIIRVGLRNHTEVIVTSVTPGADRNRKGPKSRRVSRAMAFAASESTLTQGTRLSTVTESETTNTYSLSNINPDLEKAMLPPLRMSISNPQSENSYEHGKNGGGPRNPADDY